MRKFVSCLIAFVICIVVSLGSLAAGFTDNSDAIEKAAKSVLKLYVYDNEFAEAEDYASTGSGFVAFNSSTLITNYHVIDGAAMVFGSDDDDNIYMLDKVLCADKEADIAILGFSESTNLAPLDLYADDQLKRGSPVVAIGSPKGLKNTVSSGIISYQYSTDGIPEIQITAPISPGSSGGALFNDDGKVIGVTSASYKSMDEFGENTDAQNLNFAVNISVAMAMYKAWDGTVYDFSNHKTSAKMDFTGVYDHKTSAGDQQSIVESKDDNISNESWICLNCGNENTTKYCLECGAEKPYWVCSCGKTNSSNKFCGECGQSINTLISAFNDAFENAKEKKFTEAVGWLVSLGQFDSGSFETDDGNHVVASNYIGKMYYDQAIYLQENNGEHEDIIAAFENAGDYGDAKEQIKAEDARYKKQWYDTGIEQLNNGQYDEAVESFSKADDYLKAKQQILAAYYAKGKKLLEEGAYEAAREAFLRAGQFEDATTMIMESYYQEAEQLLAEKSYDEAIGLFEQAGNYSDAKERIHGVYYVQAEEALEVGDTDKAKDYFRRAGEYKDSKERIIQIDKQIKQDKYDLALAELDKGNYSQAADLFSSISDYLDSKDKETTAQIRAIHQKYEGVNNDLNTMTEDDKTALENEVNELRTFIANDEAKSIYKQNSYILAQYYQNSSFEKAIEFYKRADGYLDAAERLQECRKSHMDNLVESARISNAIKYYYSDYNPQGDGKDYILLRPGDGYSEVEQILCLIKPLGIKTKGNIVETEYKEDYIPYVKAVEEHFGMEPDGLISIYEFERLEGAIYQGVESDEVKNVLEKLYDCGYINSLPSKHSKYEAKYNASIKKVEKEWKLQEDGVITKNEYYTIKNHKSPVPESPKNLKASVKDDTVTLSWTKVPGAINYEIRRGDELLERVVNKTTWIDKNAPTGTTVKYSVIARKYTISSQAASVSVEVPKYYKSVSVKELNGTLSSLALKGTDVKLNNLRVENWSIMSPKGNPSKDTSLFYKVRHENNYDVFLLCRSGYDYVEIIMKNYKGWDWDNDNADLLSKINQLTSISVTGTVQKKTGSWTNITKIPSIIIDHITWSYR